MKGIILAGGSGTRLYPLTMVTSKQLYRTPRESMLNKETMQSLLREADWVYMQMKGT